MHGLLFKDIHFIWSETLAMLTNNPLKLINTINTFELI